MLTCKEATLELERMKFEKPTFWKKLSINMHLMMCKACTNYKIDSAMIDKMLKDKKVVESEATFTDLELSELKKNVSQ